MPRVVLALRVAAAVGVLALAACSERAAYQVKLSRPVAVGARMGVRYTWSSDTHVVVTIGGKKAQQTDETMHADIAGVMDVLAVNALGDPTRFTVTVEKGSLVKKGGAKVAMRAGQVLIAESQGDRDTVTWKDGALDPDDAAILADAFNPAADTRPVDDDAFLGTRERVEVGATWPLDPRTVVGELARSKVEAKSENVRGAGRLVGLDSPTHPGWMLVGAELEAKDVSFPLPEQLATFAREASEIRVQFQGRLPMDPSAPALERGSEMTVTARLRQVGPKGETVYELKRVKKAAVVYTSPR